MRQMKILIIDDDIRYLMDAKRSLQSRGCAVSIHEYLLGSPVMIRSMKPDLVLLNVGMHGLSEEKLSYLIGANQRDRKAQFVFYSSRGDEGLYDAALRHEAKACIRRDEVAFLYDKVKCFLTH